MPRIKPLNDRASRIATARLKDTYPLEFLKLLNIAREEFGLPPLRSPNRWESGGGRPSTRCPIRGHAVDCLCDLG